jgi:sigma-B regulation protein RsbU (phosphoserine phosphatase)
MEKQNGKYFTIFYGVYARAARSLSFSSAGHPPALLFTGADPASAELRQLRALDPPVAMAGGLEFNTQTATLAAYVRLMLYSDGVFEIERPDGTIWKYQEFVRYVAAMATDAEPAMDRLLSHVRRMREVPTLADDFSLVEIIF